MRVGIVGWFGSDNLGDEILLHCLVSGVASTRDDASCTVFAADPSRVTEVHGVAAAPMPVLRRAGSVERQRRVQRLIADCDILLLGPGTVFQERSPSLAWPGTLSLFARIVAAARLARTPVAAVGVGVREGTTPLGRGLLRCLGAACVAVGARDRQSAARLGPRSRVIGDLAYTYDFPRVERREPTQTFALSMRPLDPEAEDHLIRSLAGCADRLRKDGFCGVFLPMAFGRGARGEDDREIYRRAFAESMDLGGNPLAESRPFADSLADWLAALTTHRVVIATRLHAALSSVALGVPTVAVAYERKVRDAFADLRLSEFTVEPNADAEALYEAALVAMQSRDAFVEAAAGIAGQAVVAREFIASVLEGL
jgi:polysaccharide pyruvyl transferase WcaK-like protein